MLKESPAATKDDGRGYLDRDSYYREHVELWFLLLREAVKIRLGKYWLIREDDAKKEIEAIVQDCLTIANEGE
jgi:hypothetical protein